MFIFSILSAALGIFTIFLLGDMMSVITNIAFENTPVAQTSPHGALVKFI